MARGKDYAGQHARPEPSERTSRRKASKTSPQQASIPVWAWMLMGLSVVMLASVLYTIGRPVGPMDMTLSSPPSGALDTQKVGATPPAPPLDKPSKAKAKKDEAVVIPPKESVTYDFYTELPSEDMKGTVSTAHPQQADARPPPEQAADLQAAADAAAAAAAKAQQLADAAAARAALAQKPAGKRSAAEIAIANAEAELASLPDAAHPATPAPKAPAKPAAPAKAEPKVEAKQVAKLEPKAAPSAPVTPKAQSKAEPKVEPEPKTELKLSSKLASKPVEKPTPKPSPAEKPKPEAPVIAKAAPAASPVASSADGGAYLVQVAAFRTRDDAERERAALALNGFSSRVEAGEVKGSTWYRVRLGPFKGKDAARTMQSRLKAAGKNAVLMAGG